MACPKYNECLNAPCQQERVCMNGDFWAAYWKEKSRNALPETEFHRPKRRLKGKRFCCYCDQRILFKEDLTEEHLVPKSIGGNHTLLNKRTCCHWCNNDRGNKPLQTWIEEAEALLANGGTDPCLAPIYKARIINATKFLKYIEEKGSLLYSKTADQIL